LNIFQVFNTVNFYINKAQASYLSVQEVMDMLNIWQIALYNQYQAIKGTSERIDTALSPFKVQKIFTTADTPSGVLTFPDTYFDIISLTATPTINGAPRQRPVDFPTESERSFREASQLIPNTVNDPFGEIVSKGSVQLYPKVPQSGTAWYYRMPAVPVLATTLISGRVLMYNAGGSTQLEWSDKDINTIIIRALSGVGINLSEEDVQNWAMQKETGPIKT